MSRPSASIFRRASGGVALVYNATLPIRILDEWCKDDTIVFELATTIYVCTYLCPRESHWKRWTDTDPEDDLSNILVAVALLQPPRSMVLLGDLNARMGSTDRTDATFLIKRRTVGASGSVALHTTTTWRSSMVLLSTTTLPPNLPPSRQQEMLSLTTSLYPLCG